MGMEHAGNTLSLSDDDKQPESGLSFSTKPLPFEEAADFFKSKIPMTKEEWESLEPKLRFRAFTVAKLAEEDYIEMVRGRLLHAIEHGEGVSETWKDIKSIAEDIGAPFSAQYWETVYRTNTQSAYNAGRLMQYQNNKPPAWELLVIEDGRTSDTCKNIVSLVGNGHALSASHAFWSTYGFPPYHFNCRTTFRAVYDYEIGHGMEIENVPMKAIRKNFKPQKGFGGNPIENGNWWMLTEGQIERGIKYGIIGEFNREENVIADYDAVWKGYTRYEGKNGGWYDLCKNPPKDWNRNKPVVEAMIKEGYKIKVIPELKNIKDNYQKDWSNPDIFVNGFLYDIKEPTEMTGSAIKKRLVSTQKRQRITKTVLNVSDKMPEDALLEGITRQANDPHNKITDIILLHKGHIKKLKITDFIKEKAK